MNYPARCFDSSTNRNLYYEEDGYVTDIRLGRIEPFGRVSLLCVLGGLLFEARQVVPKGLDIQFDVLVRDQNLVTNPVALKMDSSELVSIYTNRNDIRRRGSGSYDFSGERLYDSVNLLVDSHGWAVLSIAYSNKLIYKIGSTELVCGGAKRRTFRMAQSDRSFFEQLELPTNLPTAGFPVCAYDLTNGIFVTIDDSNAWWPKIGKHFLDCIGEE